MLGKRGIIITFALFIRHFSDSKNFHYVYRFIIISFVFIKKIPKNNTERPKALKFYLLMNTIKNYSIYLIQII